MALGYLSSMYTLFNKDLFIRTLRMRLTKILRTY